MTRRRTAREQLDQREKLATTAALRRYCEAVPIAHRRRLMTLKQKKARGR